MCSMEKSEYALVEVTHFAPPGYTFLLDLLLNPRVALGVLLAY